MAPLKAWTKEHKLASIGIFWATTLGVSLAYSRKMSSLKPSLQLIHARMHAQALTLAVLSGVALKHHYENARFVKEDGNGGESLFPPEVSTLRIVDADVEADKWNW